MRIFLGVLAGIALLYSCLWYSAAAILKENVEDNAQYFTAELRKRNARLDFSYEEITFSNFPFRPAVKIKVPKLDLDEFTWRYSLTADSLEIMMANFTNTRWEVVPDPHVTGVRQSNQIIKNYAIFVGGMPSAHVRLSTQKEGEKSRMQDFSIHHPEVITVSFDHDTMHRDIQFTPKSMYHNFFQPIYYDISSPMQFFFEILAEAESRP